LVARNKRIDILRVDAGRRTNEGRANAFLLDHLGDALYAERIADRDALLREDVPSQKAHQVGSLAGSLIHFVWPMLPEERETLALFGLSSSPASSRQPYSLLSCRLPKGGDFDIVLAPVLAVLRALAQGQQLVWPLARATLDAVRSTSLARRLSERGVVVVEERGHLDNLALLRHAVSLVHCDRRVLVDEAIALGKPVVALGDIASRRSRKSSGGAAALDARQAARIVHELLTTPREGPRGRDALDGGAAARLARLWRPWLRGQRPASVAKIEAPR